MSDLTQIEKLTRENREKTMLIESLGKQLVDTRNVLIKSSKIIEDLMIDREKAYIALNRVDSLLDQASEQLLIIEKDSAAAQAEITALRESNDLLKKHNDELVGLLKRPTSDISDISISDISPHGCVYHETN